MSEKWRWRVAIWLNHLKRTCWSDLCLWANGGDREWLARSWTPRCVEEPSFDGRCYCGKRKCNEATS